MDVRKIFGRDKKLPAGENKLSLRRSRKKNKKPALFLIGPSGKVVRL